MALNADLLYKLTEKKKYSDDLSRLYSSFNIKIAGQISDCCSQMYVNDSGEFYRTWFCKNKFCPVCSFRRSRIMEARLFPAVEELYNKKFDFVFATLTVPSCSGSELRSVVLKMSKALSDLCAKHRFSFRGAFRGLEVTYNIDSGLFHPHYHVLFVVDSDYFHSSKYVSHDDLALWWTGLTGFKGKLFDDEGNSINCVVDIRKVDKDRLNNSKDRIGSIKAVLECAKYPFKLDQLFSLPELELQSQVLQTLHRALRNIKLYSLSGILKHIEAEIRDDCNNIFILCSSQDASVSVFYLYFWDPLSSKYKLTETYYFDEISERLLPLPF